MFPLLFCCSHYLVASCPKQNAARDEQVERRRRSHEDDQPINSEAPRQFVASTMAASCVGPSWARSSRTEGVAAPSVSNGHAVRWPELASQPRARKRAQFGSLRDCEQHDATKGCAGNSDRKRRDGRRVAVRDAPHEAAGVAVVSAHVQAAIFRRSLGDFASVHDATPRRMTHSDTKSTRLRLTQAMPDEARQAAM